MKILIKDNARALFIKENHRYMPKSYSEYCDKLTQIQGQIIEVDTKFLFKDQYNTVPIKGVSEIGLRINDMYVSKVIDDIR